MKEGDKNELIMIIVDYKDSRDIDFALLFHGRSEELDISEVKWTTELVNFDARYFLCISELLDRDINI